MSENKAVAFLAGAAGVFAAGAIGGAWAFLLAAAAMLIADYTLAVSNAGFESARSSSRRTGSWSSRR